MITEVDGRTGYSTTSPLASMHLLGKEMALDSFGRWRKTNNLPGVDLCLKSLETWRGKCGNFVVQVLLEGLQQAVEMYSHSRMTQRRGMKWLGLGMTKTSLLHICTMALRAEAKVDKSNFRTAYHLKIPTYGRQNDYRRAKETAG